MRQALSTYLRQARAAAGFKKQKDLAAATGLSQQQISAWEAGRRVVPPKHARVLSRELHVPEVELLRLIGEAQAEETAGLRNDRRNVRVDRDLLLEKIERVGAFVDQYEELGHTYRTIATDVTWLVGQIPPFLERLQEINERLAQLEARIPPPGPPPPSRSRRPHESA